MSAEAFKRSRKSCRTDKTKSSSLPTFSPIKSAHTGFNKRRNTLPRPYRRSSSGCKVLKGQVCLFRHIRLLRSMTDAPAGKSFLTGLVPAKLSDPEYKSLRVASLSLDDLYLDHDAQTALSRAHSRNALLLGRGPPGTHDLPLAEQVLQGLKSINDDSNEALTVEIPEYDKSLFDGEGDRKKETRTVRGPIDLVILEGWMTGFRPLAPSALEQRYTEEASSSKKRDEQSTGTHVDTLAKRAAPFFSDHPLESLIEINEALERYEDLWDMLDAFVELRPENLGFVWGWRLEVRS